MHYRLELILPDVENLKQTIDQILEEYSESYVDEYDDKNPHAFYDWYVIGGRFSGAKLKDSLDKENLEKFYQKLRDEKITVSGFQAGKQSLQPADQIEKVDKWWREFFPGQGEVCPLFSHYNNQYDDSDGYPDVQKLGQISGNTSASHVAIAKSKYDGDGYELGYMIQDSIWNGVTFVDTKWDGKVVSALSEYRKKLEGYKDEYKQKNMPTDDWICVTIDYHS